MEKDDKFSFTIWSRLDLSMVQSLLELGANPNARIHNVTTTAAIYNSDLKAHAARLQSYAPENDRSAWSDFLFEYQVHFSNEDEDTENMQQARKVCELMISYGAERYYQKVPQRTLGTGRPTPSPDQYLKADDVLYQLFPKHAKSMIHALDKKEGQVESEAAVNAQSSDGRCVMM